MELPEDVETWTYETVREIVARHAYEPERFDFKEVLTATKDDHANKHNDNLRKAAASLANSGGGYLLFGVRDRGAGETDPERRIRGIPAGGDLGKELGEKLSRIQPPLPFTPSAVAISLPGDPARVVYVAHIPRSPRRPHMVMPHGIFYRRDAGGSAQVMDYAQVRDLLIVTETGRQKVPRVQIELRLIRVILDQSLLNYGKRGSILAFNRFTTQGLQVLLTNASDLPLDTREVNDLFSLLTLCNHFNTNMSQVAALPPWYLAFATLRWKNIRDMLRPLLAELDTLCTRCEAAVDRQMAALAAESPPMPGNSGPSQMP